MGVIRCIKSNILRIVWKAYSQHPDLGARLHYIAFGRAWQHAKDSHRVWESFAQHARTILRTFKHHPNREKRNIL